MNKWEEALQIIRSEIDASYEAEVGIPYRAMHSANVIEELVKRATPMKPKNATNETPNVYQGNCSVCLSYLENDSYCPTCGQCIDWSEVK